MSFNSRPLLGFTGTVCLKLASQIGAALLSLIVAAVDHPPGDEPTPWLSRLPSPRPLKGCVSYQRVTTSPSGLALFVPHHEKHAPDLRKRGGPRGTRTHNLRIKSRLMPVSLPAASCPSRHVCAGQRRAEDGVSAGVSTAVPARVRWFGRSLGRSRGVQVAREPEPAHLVAMADALNDESDRAVDPRARAPDPEGTACACG